MLMAGHFTTGRPFFLECQNSVLFVCSKWPAIGFTKMAGHFFQEMDQTSKNGLPLISPMPIFPKINC